MTKGKGISSYVWPTSIMEMCTSVTFVETEALCPLMSDGVLDSLF